MPSINLDWSPSEEKIARAAYDAAVEAALAEVMAELKRQAAAAKASSDMWEIEDYLRNARRDIDTMFIYRYSKLPDVFAYAIHKGYIDEARLGGLADDKLSVIRRFLSFGHG